MRGMTWDHPRGFDPLAAAATLWEHRTGTSIRWDRRSLQDFETYPVEALARDYDLIVIDHPHVGQIADSGCLVALDTVVEAGVLADIAAGSIGGSYESYRWAGRQWALPVDAAAQVQAWVPGRIAAPIVDWAELGALAAAGRVALPLRPPHGLMSLFTMCGLLGVSLDNTATDDLFPPNAAGAVERLATLASALDPICYTMDPIAVLEAMAQADATVAVAPLIYGYVSYAVEGFRARTVHFADIPMLGHGRRGSALGGTGIAVSAYGDDPRAAAGFAGWIASGATQRDVVAAYGGQPAHAAAWNADTVNRASHDFYRATRATLDQAWLRPRHHGYMAFQHAASERLNEGLRTGEAPDAVIAALNRLYAASR